MEFAPGDVAELRSGSPLLTVISATADAVNCVWFEESAGEFRTYEFLPILLDKVEVLEDEDEDEDEDDEGEADEDER